MNAHRILGAALAALFLFALNQTADARKRDPHAVVPVTGAVIDDRFSHLREPEAYATARAWPKADGIASFYDCKKPGECKPHKITASGAPFRPHVLAAAHRTLPFGTRVRVINRNNRKSVVVTINDRGPFIRGRVIDLTPAAARAIGLSGIAPVTIEKL